MVSIFVLKDKYHPPAPQGPLEICYILLETFLLNFVNESFKTQFPSFPSFTCRDLKWERKCASFVKLHRLRNSCCDCLTTLIYSLSAHTMHQQKKRERGRLEVYGQLCLCPQTLAATEGNEKLNTAQRFSIKNIEWCFLQLR